MQPQQKIPTSTVSRSHALNQQELDHQLSILQQNKESWLHLPLKEKIRLAKELLDRTTKVADWQIDITVQHKHIPRDNSAAVGAEWLTGPVICVRTIRILIEMLEQIEQNGIPTLPEKDVQTAPNGQLRVKVFPSNLIEKPLFSGYSGEVWLQPDVTKDSLYSNMATLYQNTHATGKVALVLGAGNQSSIPMFDVLYKLFNEGQVCILKMHPINEYLGPIFEEIFAPFIERGFMQIVYGGVEVGQYLCYHKDVDEVHITGSIYTHDAIVFGTGEEGKTNLARNTPILKKKITSELGNVSPVIVVPGKWTQHELHFQAEKVATQLTENAGFNCNASRIIITQRDWPQREAFLNALREILGKVPTRAAYYPGAKERHQIFVKEHPNAETFGSTDEQSLPWTLIPNIDPTQTQDICFQTEAFCSVIAETSLPEPDAASFLKRAVQMCNDTIWGSLNVCILIRPDTQKAIQETFSKALEDIRYGLIGVNVWPAVGYGLCEMPWGAYPGHTLDDANSGIGIVHNIRMFDKVEKGILYSPFTTWPRPIWFVTNQKRLSVAGAFFKFQRHPNLLNMLRVMLKGILG